LQHQTDSAERAQETQLLSEMMEAGPVRTRATEAMKMVTGAMMLRSGAMHRMMMEQMTRAMMMPMLTQKKASAPTL
jgi:hypothetical protein